MRTKSHTSRATPSPYGNQMAVKSPLRSPRYTQLSPPLCRVLSPRRLADVCDCHSLYRRGVRAGLALFTHPVSTARQG
jgi:hypothetical protein